MELTCSYNLPLLPLQIDVETKKVLKKLSSARAALAELNGITKLIPQPTILINALTLQEAKDSSAIENIITTHDELYKADLQIGSISTDAKEVQDYKTALVAGYHYIEIHQTLVINHIRDIQKKIEHNDAGIRKTGGTVLKNDQTGEIVYIPPQDYQQIIDYLTNLEYYINITDDTDLLVKLAIIHHQFESIHPFHDGNGRTGRIINILYLVLNKLLDLPILYLSGYIVKNKSEYYRLLQHVRDTGDRESWIMYMLEGIEQTSKATTIMIQKIWNLMGETKKIIKEQTSFYTKDFLELLFQHPYTKIDFVVQELGIVRQTASKYLQELEKIGILQMIQIKKEKYYINTKLYDLFRQGLELSN